MSRAVEETNRRLLRARDAMDRAYAEPLDVPALARIAYVSEAHFIRTFRATFGETPHRYLQRRRVERAMWLLRETDRSVTDICLDVGFTSLGTFSRTFREIVGESPVAYRAAPRRSAAPCRPASPWPGRDRAVSEKPAGRARRLESRAMTSTRSPTRTSASSTSRRRSTSTSASSGWRSRPTTHRGGFRWLTVGVPGEAIREIVLDVPGPPAMDEKTAEQVRELVTKGATGGRDGASRTDDCFGTYERLRAKGVEFTQEATDHGYGIDCGLRDPFGNQIRILQPKALAGLRPAAG